MRGAGITGVWKRRARRTTQSNHAYPVAPNVLQRAFTVEKPNQAWMTDLTYVWTAEGWLYVDVILDLYSRKVVGWSMGARIDTELTLKALRIWLR